MRHIDTFHKYITVFTITITNKIIPRFSIYNSLRLFSEHVDIAN